MSNLLLIVISIQLVIVCFTVIVVTSLIQDRKKTQALLIREVFFEVLARYDAAKKGGNDATKSTQ